MWLFEFHFLQGSSAHRGARRQRLKGRNSRGKGGKGFGQGRKSVAALSAGRPILATARWRGRRSILPPSIRLRRIAPHSRLNFDLQGVRVRSSRRRAACDQSVGSFGRAQFRDQWHVTLHMSFVDPTFGSVLCPT